MRLFDDGFHAAQLSVYLWAVFGLLAGLLAATSATGPLAYWLIGGALVGPGLVIGSGLLVGAHRDRWAGASMMLGVVATPIWFLWPVTVIGVVLGAVLFGFARKPATAVLEAVADRVVLRVPIPTMPSSARWERFGLDRQSQAYADFVSAELDVLRAGPDRTERS